VAVSGGDHQIVRVDCPDEVGLIHRITGVLGSRRLNIEANQEFVDTLGRHFFFRAEVEAVDAPPAPAELAAELADAGPIIAQDVIPVDHTFTPERMARAGRDVEKLVLARAVQLLLEERVFLHGGRTVVFA
jgi:formyltetrahydrofolate hydrolase